MRRRRDRVAVGGLFARALIAVFISGRVAAAGLFARALIALVVTF